VASAESASALSQVGEVDRLKDIIWEGDSSDSSILATLLGPSDGLSVLSASSTGRLGRSLLIGDYLFITVKTFFVLHCGAFLMTVKTFFVLHCGTFLMAVKTFFVLHCGTFLMAVKTFFVLHCATLLHRFFQRFCVGIGFFRLPSPLVIRDLLEPEDRDNRLESTLICRAGIGIWFVLSGDLEPPPSSASVRAPPPRVPF
jgi:hypothetical protein